MAETEEMLSDMAVNCHHLREQRHRVDPYLRVGVVVDAVADRNASRWEGSGNQ